jgi:hypothetical protein
MNRQTRRALSKVPEELLAPATPRGSPFPQTVTSALFAANRTDCACECCRLLRKAVDAMIAESLDDEGDADGR